MITEPTLEDRAEQPTVGIRAEVTPDELATVAPQLIDDVVNWLETQRVAPAGPVFIRYWAIDMASTLQIEVGVPIAGDVPTDTRVARGSIPAGRYAVLRYTGDYAGLMEANGVLIDWAEANGIAWDTNQGRHGGSFGGRFEFYLNGPDTEPDPSKWNTEVAIRVADPAQAATN